jgi:hypothetical protein
VGQRGALIEPLAEQRGVVGSQQVQAAALLGACWVAVGAERGARAVRRAICGRETKLASAASAHLQDQMP